MKVKEKKQTLCEQAIAEIRSIVQKEKGNEEFRFPSERVLAEQLNVSRITVRNAYQVLLMKEF
jgi:DNA-binding GntR family transcriptional regulator